MARDMSQSKGTSSGGAAEKLAWGMTYFTIAVLLMLVVFLAIWALGDKAPEKTATEERAPENGRCCRIVCAKKSRFT